MRSVPQPVEEFGPRSRWEALRADQSDARGWLSDAPVCGLLANEHIAHVGRMWATAPFEVVRDDASGTFAMVVVEGAGEVLVGGEWRQLDVGQACLLPAFSNTGIRAAQGEGEGEGKGEEGGSVWEFAWVRYLERRETAPVLSRNSPVVSQTDPAPLVHAIAGLRAESMLPEPEGAALHHWVELVHGFVQRTARPHRLDDRLWRVWEAVEADLARRWTLGDLSDIAHLCPEQVRRLCREQLGRTAIQQVTQLRMRKAAELLSTTDDTVEAIAGEIGYDSPFTFSNAFLRWTGRRPSKYRSKALGG